MTPKFITLGLAFSVGAALLATGASAVTVVNASFETPVLAAGTYQGDGVGTDGAYGGALLPGWAGSGASGAQNFGNPTIFVPADGANVAYLNGSALYQDVGVLHANTTYKLTVAAGNQPGYGIGSTGQVALLNGVDLTGGVLSATAVGSLPVGSMTNFVTSFRTGATVTGDLVVALEKTTGNQILFDNVSLSAVPEPSTWALLFVGIGCMGVALRHGRKSALISA